MEQGKGNFGHILSLTALLVVVGCLVCAVLAVPEPIFAPY